MSAYTKVYVKVVVEEEKWVAVHAVSLDEAVAVARESEPVTRVLAVQYDAPDVEV